MELRSGRRLCPTQQICSGFASGMELRSGRRLRPTKQLSKKCSPGHRPDHISALPVDLLLRILARLGCAATAARTSVLSRRWRGGLWTRLHEIVLRGVEFHNLEPVLGRVSPVVSVLEIHVSDEFSPSKIHVNSLLRAAARLEPQELVLSLPSTTNTPGQVAIPCFRRATSIVLDTPFLDLPHVLGGAEFPVLETLAISAYYVAVETLLSRCPRLRLLKLSVCNYKVTLRSGSLQELVLETRQPWVRRVEIAAPELKQLTLSTSASTNMDISILAPLLQKVSWHCSYKMETIVLGAWYLDKLRLHTADQPGDVTNSLHIHAGICRRHFEETNFTHEIEKHMVAAFSALELHLTTSGHVFGAFVFRVIGMNRIRNDMHRLKVVLLQGSTPVKEEEGCPTNCSCDPPNWKTQSISLTALKEMDIDGFKGEDHEYDFMKLVFMSAPILERVTLKLSHEDLSSSSASTDQLYDIFKVYSSVECCVYLSSGELISPCIRVGSEDVVM